MRQGLCSLQWQHHSHARASKNPVLVRDITPIICCDMLRPGQPTELSPKSSRMSVLLLQQAFTARLQNASSDSMLTCDVAELTSDS